jgi:hypothetical protein
MTVRYMIVTDECDGTTTYQVVAKLADADNRFVRACVAELREGGKLTVNDTTFTVTPVVWRARGYVRASDVSGIEQPDNLPLDNGMTTR